MRENSKAHNGFTLMECLIALLVLSGMLVTFSLLISTGKQMIEAVDGSSKKEFEVFLLQLEREVQDYEFRGVEDNVLSFRKDKTVSVSVRQSGERVDKKDNKGTQPLLTSVKNFKAMQKECTVEIEVTFIDGKIFKGKWVAPRGQ